MTTTTTATCVVVVITRAHNSRETKSTQTLTHTHKLSVQQSNEPLSVCSFIHSLSRFLNSIHAPPNDGSGMYVCMCVGVNVLLDVYMWKICTNSKCSFNLYCHASHAHTHTQPSLDRMHTNIYSPSHLCAFFALGLKHFLVLSLSFTRTHQTLKEGPSTGTTRPVTFDFPRRGSGCLRLISRSPVQFFICGWERWGEGVAAHLLHAREPQLTHVLRTSSVHKHTPNLAIGAQAQRSRPGFVSRLFPGGLDAPGGRFVCVLLDTVGTTGTSYTHSVEPRGTRARAQHTHTSRF